MNHYSDKELLDFYQNNGSLGFQKIVKQFQERVYWQIRRLTKNHQDTEDVMQNVFIKVWNALPKFKGDSALYTWIYRIAMNVSISFFRSNIQRKANTFPINESIFQEVEYDINEDNIIGIKGLRVEVLKASKRRRITPLP